MNYATETNPRCDVAWFEEHAPPATYALSLTESNSASNISFTCDECLKLQLDYMLGFDVGSVEVQSMTIEQREP